MNIIKCISKFVSVTVAILSLSLYYILFSFFFCFTRRDTTNDDYDYERATKIRERETVRTRNATIFSIRFSIPFFVCYINDESVGYFCEIRIRCWWMLSMVFERSWTSVFVWFVTILCAPAIESIFPFLILGFHRRPNTFIL